MSSGKLIGAGILTAVAASLCCITPVLALLAGSGSVAYRIPWVEPARPYMIGATILLLGFSWGRKLKPSAKDDCNCTPTRKTKFIQSKEFLLLVTVFSALMLAFPYYSYLFFPKITKAAVVTNKADLQWVDFKISGMTCQACEEEVKHEVNKTPGIINVNVSYEKGAANVRFDKSRTNVQRITEAIEMTGYKVVTASDK